MTHLIKDGRIVADPWQWIRADEPPGIERLDDQGHFLLPLELWRSCRDTLAPAQAGVWLAPDDSPEALLPWLAGIPLIAIHFPTFTDGRGYSLARLLRNRYGYAGELRAVGDVLRDQLYFLHGCGFDAFQLRADQAPAEALAAFRDYAWRPVTAR